MDGGAAETPTNPSDITRGLKAVILDMDGVIIDGMPYHLRAWQEAFKSVGIDVTDTDIYLREGMDQLETVAQIARDRGVVLSPEEMERVMDLKNHVLNAIFKLRFIPGSTELLSRFRGLGLRLALVTGTRGDVVEKILSAEHAIKDVFDVVITAETVRHKKPHPEPYLKAVELLGVEKGRCLVVENSPAGIASAKGAGLRCIALTTSLPEDYLREADYIFHSLREVAELFN